MNRGVWLLFTVLTVFNILINPACTLAPYIYVTNFEVTPSPIAEGASATLRWNVPGATKVEIDNGIGEVPPYGNISIKPSSTTTYTITAYNIGRVVQENITVSVIPRSPLTSPPPTIPTLSAMDTKQLFPYLGKQVKVEGIVTDIRSFRPFSNADQTWIAIFFNNLAGSSATAQGSTSNLMEYDYVSYFRAIIKAENVNNFTDYPNGPTVIKWSDNIVITGTLESYKSAPVIYLIDKSQITFH